MKSVRAILAIVGGILLLPTLCQGKIPDGLLCEECHTMHNSQGGNPMTLTDAQERLPMLLRNTCLGCHTGSNTGGGIPFVFNTSEPTYGTDTLAGGNFYWVGQGNNRKGHNVTALNATNDFSDTELASPPGYAATAPAWTDDTLTCAGIQGCHGARTEVDEASDLRDNATHLGAHHTDDKSAALDGASIGTSFRFLNGIVGLEDPNWEYTKSASDHNQYKGKIRLLDTDDASSDATATDGSISSLCAQCHGDFHNGTVEGNVDGGTWGSPWVRHPTDFDMNDATGAEYASYGGGTHDYNPNVPLASSDVSAVKSTVLAVAGDAIIMCLSCHRAHGSPYESILRWDFRGWPGVAGTYGCYTCHTTKD